VTRPLALLLTFAAAAALTHGAGDRSAARPSGAELTQVVVELAHAPLARSRAVGASRRIDGEQRAFERALRSVPGARVHWRYRVVANGMSVVLPRTEVGRLSSLPGVRRVYGPTTYHALVGPDAPTIRARDLGGSTLASAGDGIKIGIIDDGVDQTHAFFDPTEFTMPAGFPKGQVAYTTAKVIVARSFPPPNPTTENAAKPFDPDDSSHATHVAGIAAGNANTLAEGNRISGIAPRAYIGNYKALTVPTDSGLGLNGNAPEIVAAIEAAVADGMDVINLSIGEPEVEPSRDLVALALDAAAAAGVVPVVAAGNDYDDFGEGSVASPGSSAAAITVGASTSGGSPSMTSFSSAGPTPISLRLKPDLVAPGASILSSAPDGWRTSSGTSMATPHVSGAAALLLQRHPEWTPADVKAALTVTARPLTTGSGVAPTRAGAGLVDVAAADVPLLRPTPTAVSFGLVRGRAVRRSVVRLDDAGGGQGEWAAAVESLSVPSGTTLTLVQGLAAVPGDLTLEVSPGATEGEISGVVVLRRDGVSRRIPLWGLVATPKLAAPSGTLVKPGEYGGNTRGRAARVDAYRYPQIPTRSELNARLAGPEQVFRVRIKRAVANFGVVITSRANGVTVEPRIVVNGDENRLTGYAALPLNQNPYEEEFGEPTLAAGAMRPARGTYDIVFDSPTRAGAGKFTFRFWVDDVAPPKASFVRRTVVRGERIRLRISDGGSGIDPTSVEAFVDGRAVPARVRGNEVTLDTAALAAGRHRVRMRLADYQETRNNENVTRILPNTRVVSAIVTVRR
jgi:hypothetical protein